jgi:hypothetical protein
MIQFLKFLLFLVVTLILFVLFVFLVIVSFIFWNTKYYMAIDEVSDVLYKAFYQED